MKTPLAFLACLLLGCGDSNGPGSSQPFFVSVTIDGQQWKPTFFQGFLEDTVASVASQRVSGGTAEGLLLMLHSFHGVDQYAAGTIPTTSAGASFTVDEGPLGVTFMATSSAQAGTITITGFSASDSTMAGTFNFPVFVPGEIQPRHTIAGSFRVRDGF